MAREDGDCVLWSQHGAAIFNPLGFVRRVTVFLLPCLLCTLYGLVLCSTVI